MSEQPRAKMRYPKGRIVLVRDCTVAICLNNNPGAVLLSTLLFWYDNPHIGDFYSAQTSTFTMCRTQEEIAQQACGQVDTKTIHNVAVPFLQLFGFLDLKEKMNGNLYILHIDRILAAYAAYEKGPRTLKAYLLSCLQLEKFLIEIEESQLENFLINKKFLLLQLEKILIRNREISNCKRGRKPKQQAARGGEMANTENLRDSLETYNRERAENARALSENEHDFQTEETFSPHQGTVKRENDSYRHEPTAPHPAFNCQNWQGAHPGKSCEDYQAWIDGGGREEPTDPDIPVVTTQAIASRPGEPDTSPPSAQTRQSLQRGPAPETALEAASGQKTPDMVPSQTSPSQGPTDGAATVGSGSEPRASDESCVTNEDVTQAKLRIAHDWDIVQGRPEPRTRRFMAAVEALVPANPTREELRGCRDWLPKTDRPEKPWYALHGVGIWDIAEKLGLYRHHLALSIQPAPLADVKQPTPMDIYTQASMDKEVTERNLKRLRDSRLAKEAAAKQAGVPHGAN